MTNRRVGIVFTSINADLIQYTSEIFSYLKGSFNVTLFKSEYSDFGARLVSANASIGLTQNKSASDVIGTLRSVPRIIQTFRGRWNDFDVIFFTSASIANMPVALLFKLFGHSSKLIFVLHDVRPHPGLKSLIISMYNWFVRRVADTIVVHSKFSENQLVNEYQYKGELFQIPLGGFDVTQGKNREREYFLFFGRIDKYKGLEQLLPLVLKNPHLSFVIAGKGADRSLTQLDEFPNVSILNRFIEHSELEDLFGRAKAVILPYTSATQSGVVLLSYSFGVPVISTNVGGLSEYIIPGETGFITDSTQEFYSCVESWSQDEEIYERCRNFYLKNYSSEALKSEYLKLFGALEKKV